MRRTPLKRSVNPRLQRRKPPGAGRPRLQPETRVAAFRLWEGRCAVCGEPATQAHHVFPKQRWPEFIDDAENLLPLCERCHSRHETASRRIPRSLCAYAEALLPLSEPMRRYLEKTYPVDPL